MHILPYLNYHVELAKCWLKKIEFLEIVHWQLLSILFGCLAWSSKSCPRSVPLT